MKRKDEKGEVRESRKEQREGREKGGEKKRDK